MLEFASLFLGLIWGRQPVEMVVGDPRIARLELLLDGRPAAVVTAPPWKAEVDFGPLAPHRLEVLAASAGGERLARAEQWINLPRPPAEARLVVEQDPAGRNRHAVLKWESVVGKPPISTEIRFDGVVLPVADPARFPLPPADLAELHFLTAVLVFPDGSTAHAEASFGGQFGDQVETELTAFPVRARKKNAPLEPLYSCFADAEGKRLRIAQVEQGDAEVIFVRDAGAEVLLQRLRAQAAQAPMASRVGSRPRTTRTADYLRYDMSLEAEDRVRFVWPNLLEAEHPHFAKAAFFESTPFVTAKDGGIFFFLTRLYPEKKGGAQHLADAMALAGLRAAAEGRRRAVVLVTGDQRPAEHSTQTAESVQGFLEALAVPIHLWSGNPSEKAKEWAADWPPAKAIANVDQLRKAFRSLEEDLDSQRIVWIGGRHLASGIGFDGKSCPDFAPLFP